MFTNVCACRLLAAAWAGLWLRCMTLSLRWPHLPQSTGTTACGPQRPLHAGSLVVAHRPSCSAAGGIFLDQGLNLCLLNWQADSLPLSWSLCFKVCCGTLREKARVG